LILGLASELVIPDVAAASDVSGLLRECGLEGSDAGGTPGGEP
jgi:hypothetical protein